MQRRTLLLAAPAALILPCHALASERVFYTPGLAEEAMDQGKTVFLDFWTNWCTTCAAQDRVIADLRASDPAYDAAITFITVDWDEYSDAQISRDLGIPRRSTLVALMGREEIGRIVAGTSRQDIKTLMDAALVAATS
ncbi:MAG: thioredoxin family protein [Rhodobacteraceae bacterium]|nr:thioredoxin family protein [Paracoccaceae bacterium]